MLQSAVFRFLQPEPPSLLDQSDSLGLYFSRQEQITKNILAKKVSKINLKLMPTFAKMNLFAMTEAGCHH